MHILSCTFCYFHVWSSWSNRHEIYLPPLIFEPAISCMTVCHLCTGSNTSQRYTYTPVCRTQYSSITELNLPWFIFSAFQCDKQPVCCNDLYKEPDYGNNLDLYAGCNLDLCADVCVMDHNANDDISSKSSDTCATAESFENPLFSEISSDSDIYKTSTSQSESDTSSF